MWTALMVLLAYANGYLDGKIAAHREHVRQAEAIRRVARSELGRP